ncbi:WAS/WASL-interacting protein family member 1-like [Meles meles]|uniref:WAS/WASL-interacting protein family member 1-like n=1 Tax=Meles meles TaxID=9662 RepID=UPI001E69B8EA|nr:WAS/WASL-interacting protein family member 1-like [Meles meles]
MITGVGEPLLPPGKVSGPPFHPATVIPSFAIVACHAAQLLRPPSRCGARQVGGASGAGPGRRLRLGPDTLRGGGSRPAPADAPDPAANPIPARRTRGRGDTPPGRFWPSPKGSRLPGRCASSSGHLSLLDVGCGRAPQGLSTPSQPPRALSPPEPRDRRAAGGQPNPPPPPAHDVSRRVLSTHFPGRRDCACAGAVAQHTAPPAPRQTSRYFTSRRTTHPNCPADLESSKPLRTLSGALNVRAPPSSDHAPFRPGASRPPVLPIIYFFPRATPQQLSDWLILRAGAEEGR